MRTLLPFSLIALFACGDAEEECVEPEVNLIVTVIDSAEEPILDAEVELDGEACDELGGGEYSCSVQRWANNLHVFASKLPDYRSSATFVEVWEPDECDVFEEHVELRLSSYIGGT